MAKEIEDGKIADPMEMQQLEMGIHPEQMPGGAMNPEAPMDPAAMEGEEEAPQPPRSMPKGGEI